MGFEWSLPVIFSKSTDPLWPDPGASIEKRIEVELYDEKVRTTLSMIIHKLVACSLLHPKLFILSPNVRVERRERKSTGWHIYEFTQLDFEARSASSKDIMRLCELILRGMVEDLNEHCSQTLDSLRNERLGFQTSAFDVFDREELVAKYGEEWESRLPLEIRDPVWVTDIPREFYDYQDLRTQKWDNYDLYLPRYGEVLSGSKREWEYEKILTKMQRDGVAKENYALLLQLARLHRLKPSAGRRDRYRETRKLDSGCKAHRRSSTVSQNTWNSIRTLTPRTTNNYIKLNTVQDAIVQSKQYLKQWAGTDERTYRQDH